MSREASRTPEPDQLPAPLPRGLITDQLALGHFLLCLDFDGTISVIDYPAKKVVQTLAANVHGANRLKFTLDGKRVLVSTLGAPDLVVLDAATRKVIKRIPIGHGGAGILMQPDGSRATG